MKKISEVRYREIIATETPTAQEWNERHQPGMEVTLILDDRSTLETKTRGLAWEVADGIAVVCVNGKAGGYRLNRILPKALATGVPAQTG